MQIVRDEENAQPTLFAQAGDEIVEIGLAGIVDAARRLIKYKKIGIAKQGSGDQNALQLTTRELPKLLIGHALCAGIRQHAIDRGLRSRAAERQEPAHRHRDGAVDVKALRHIANDRRLGPHNLAAIRAVDAEHQLDERGLAGPIGTDQRDDFARHDVEIDMVDQGAAVAAVDKATGGDQRVGIGTTHVLMAAGAGMAVMAVRPPGRCGRAMRMTDNAAALVRFKHRR